MNIGIDARLWNETGVGRYIRNLVKELAVIDKKNTYTLFVLQRDYKVISAQLSSLDSQKQFTLVSVTIRWHGVKEQLQFPSIISQHQVDLMHFPYFSLPLFYNKPYVVTIHDLILHHFETGEASTLPLPVYKLKHRGYKFIIQQAAKKAKKILTVSEATKQEIIEHLHVSPQKIVVTYEGVDQHLVHTGKKRLINEKYFLYVGNLYPHKNIATLLRAFQELKNESVIARKNNEAINSNNELDPERSIMMTSNNEKRLPRRSSLTSRNDNVKLVIVGKRDYFFHKTVEQVHAMGLQNSVTFLGHVPDEELSELYHHAEATIVPSLMEGFGLPALEAMQNECLVIASDIPVLKEICQDNALYFNPKSPESLVATMQTVLSKEKTAYKKQITEGVKRTKMFSWRKMAEETLKVYEQSD